jgi:hypothetical protein
MKKFHIGILSVLFVLLPMAAFATSDKENVRSLLEHGKELADQQGWTIMDSKIDNVTETTFMYYTVSLDPGTYAFLAKAGDNIVDLDMHGYYKDDYDNGNDPFIEDVAEDAEPVIEFTLDTQKTIVTKVDAAKFAEGRTKGYFCILFCQEPDQTPPDTGSRDQNNGGNGNTKPHHHRE